MDLTDSMNKHLLNISIPVTERPNGIMFSWTVSLYRNNHIYSTKLSVDNKQKWQDHWLQAFYALHETERVEGCIELIAYMSDTNWRFDCCLRKQDVNSVKSSMMKPLQCSCGFHLLMSPSLIGMYNDLLRNQKMSAMIERIVSHPPAGILQTSIITSRLYS